MEERRRKEAPEDAEAENAIAVQLRTAKITHREAHSEPRGGGNDKNYVREAEGA
jgi:hypothetical protein